MLSDFKHQAGRATRDRLYEALAKGQSRAPWTDEQVASFMASAVRQTIENCINIVGGCSSTLDACEKLQRLITASSSGDTV